MRKSMIFAGLLIVASVATSAQADDKIQLNGSVALSCSVAVTDLGQDINLKTGEFQKVLGSVVEDCNSGNGYTITLSSANSGQMKNGNWGITYGFFYDAQLKYLSVPAVFSRTSAQFNKKIDLKLDVSRSDNYIAGNYTDTVLIAIAAK